MGQRGKGIKDAQSSANWRLIMMIHRSELYDSFEIANNRDVDQKHVLALMRSIVASDHTPSHPISVKCVDEKMWIFDGQHRFVACRNLGIPIYYVIDDDASEEALLTIQTSKKWTAWDNICYLAKKDDGFKYFKQAVENVCRYMEAPGITIAKALFYGNAGGNCGFTAHMFTNERALIFEKRYQDILRIQDECMEMLGGNFFSKGDLNYALIRALAMGADIDRLIDRLNIAGKSIQTSGGRDFVISEVVNLYNHKLRHGRLEKPTKKK
jgi:hypothetical protein